MSNKTSSAKSVPIPAVVPIPVTTPIYPATSATNGSTPDIFSKLTPVAAVVPYPTGAIASNPNDSDNRLSVSLKLPTVSTNTKLSVEVRTPIIFAVGFI